MIRPAKHRVQRIFDYLKDKLSKKERYAFDREISKDPFLADAMDGFSQLDPEELLNDLELLDKKLHHKINKKKTRRLIPYVSIAAGVALVIGIGSLILIKNLDGLTGKKLAQETFHDSLKDSIETPLLSPETPVVARQEKKYDTDVEKGSPPKEVLKTKEEELVLEPVLAEQKQVEEENIPEEDYSEIALQSEPIKEFEVVAKKDVSEVEAPVIISSQQQASAPEEALAGRTAGVEVKTKSRRGKATETAEAADFEEAKVAESAPVINILPNNVQGVVVDAMTGEPIIGASVIQDDRGTITDMDGNFSFEIENDSVIQIAYIGYKTKEVHLQDLKNSNKIEIEADEVALSEVVVVGYGTQKKQDVTGAVSRVELNSEPPENLSYSIWAKGVRINYNSGFEVHAEPVGGVKKFSKYIKSNSKHTPEKDIKVVLEFYVYETGRLGGIDVKKADVQEYADEAVRLLVEGPEWTPAENNGSKAKELVNLKITFEKE